MNTLRWTAAAGAVLVAAWPVRADFSFSAATRTVGAMALSSDERWGYHPGSVIRDGTGLFQVGVAANSSGDYGVEASAWERSVLGPSGLEVHLSASSQVNGIEIPGAWFVAGSRADVSARFTVDGDVPYWVGIDDDGVNSLGEGWIRSVAPGGFEAEFSRDGSWSGVLPAGEYQVWFAASSERSGYLATFWAVVGVPAPASWVFLAAGVLGRRARR